MTSYSNSWISPLDLFKVASSSLQYLFDLAFSSLQSIYNSITASISSEFPDIPKLLNRISTAQPHFSAYSLISNPTPEKLLILLIPLLILLFSMSAWGRLWNSGRYSPFTAAAPVGASPPTVTENDYDYLGPDDIVDSPRGHVHGGDSGYNIPNQRNATRIDSTSPHSPHSPDILVLKHRGTTYPLHLPAFSIGEGVLKVGDLRRLAARETKTDDPRRVKLLYKGKALKDDHRPCCDEGLKQNSELMCVISEAGHLGRREDVESSDSADSEEMLESGLGGPRVEGDGGSRESRPKRKGHRGGRRRTRAVRDSSVGASSTPRTSSSFLTPQDSHPTTHSYSPSPRANSPHVSTHTHAQPTAPKQPNSPPRPKTPLEILDALSHTFHSELVPKCKLFLAHPPSDAKTRDMEYKRLSETILAQIILKLDAVVTEGDEGLRTKRRELVKQTQSLLNELDRFGKAGK